MLWLIYWWIVAAIVDARFWISRGIAKRSRGRSILRASRDLEEVENRRESDESVFNRDFQAPCKSLAD